MSADSAAILPPHVKLDSLVGPLLLPREDAYIMPEIRAHGHWEPSETAALQVLISPGASVVEIGAHVGYLTLVCARAAGPSGTVLAIEAAPDNAALLRANVARANATAVRVVHAAAWSETGELALHLSPDNTGDHRAYAYAGAAGSVRVPAVTVDDLLGADGRVDVVKCDAQGCDHIALVGMAGAIERCRPTVLIEFWPEGIEGVGDSPQELLASYRELGYEIAVLDEPGLGPCASNQAIVSRALRKIGGYCTLILHGRRYVAPERQAA